MTRATPTSTAEPKRIPWRKRADLQCVPLEFEGRPAWGIKDPVTLRYFELREEAWFVWNHLDGQQTPEALCRAFHERFRPRTLSMDELKGFLGQLISQGLVVAESPGHGRLLVTKEKSARTRRRWGWFANLLALRFRGFDPDRLLTWLLVRLRWLFSPGAILAGLLLIATALTLVVVQFDELVSRLPDAQALLTPTNLLWLSLLLASVKVLHELGHGLTCKHFGGECRELGFMLLVFSPTLYCNVTDIWMLKDKWRRIAVSAAGMWVEVLIASACTLLWWFSAPGLFHTLCLNLMLICGVSTFVFNGNPLLRYDGYFVLADWLEVPNLQQQSRSAVQRRVARWFCGFDPGAGDDTSSRREWGLVAYGVASTAYRLLLTFVILWVLHHWLEPYGLAVFVQLLAVPVVGLIVLNPLMTAATFLRSPVHRTRIDWLQFMLRTGATLLVLALLFSVPLPARVTAAALVDDDQAQRIYATHAGTLVDGVRIGQQVIAGQELARLEEPKLRDDLIRLEGEAKQLRLRLEQLERRRINEPNVAAFIPTVREAVRDLEQQLAQRRGDAERLVLRASRAGTVLPPASRHGGTTSGALRTWTGTPLDERNRGCFLTAGTTVCLIGEADSRAALLMVDQRDINLVRVGQTVRFLWNELSGEVLTGKIVELAALDLSTLPREAVLRLNLPARVSADGVLRPVGTWYQARVHLDETDVPLPRDSAGTAKILIEPQSLSTRFLRWLKQTFPM